MSVKVFMFALTTAKSLVESPSTWTRLRLENGSGEHEQISNVGASYSPRVRHISVLIRSYLASCISTSIPRGG